MGGVFVIHAGRSRRYMCSIFRRFSLLLCRLHARVGGRGIIDVEDNKSTIPYRRQSDNGKWGIKDSSCVWNLPQKEGGMDEEQTSPSASCRSTRGE